MRKLYDNIDVNDEEISPLIRFLAVLERADSLLGQSLMIIDEEGEPHGATAAALEAASACIAAAARAEVLDPWWKDHQPPVSELPFGLTPAERVNEVWARECGED